MEALEQALQQELVALGYELVELRRAGSRHRPVLRLRIDRVGGAEGGVGTDDCARVSRALERWLEGPGGIGPRYELEVSSPGIERPVRFPDHWRRYTGRAVRVRSAALPGRPVARIVAVPDDAHVVLDPGTGPVTVPLAAIREATLAVDWTTIGKRTE